MTERGFASPPAHAARPPMPGAIEEALALTPATRRRRALRAAATVERDLLGLERTTLRAIVAELEAARSTTIEALVGAPTDWKMTHAKAVLGELGRRLATWQQRAASAMQAAGDPAAALGTRLTTDVLAAGGIASPTAPMIPDSVVRAAYQQLPDLLRDVSDDAVLRVGRVLRQSVLGQQTPLDAMRAIGRITEPSAKGPFRNAALRSEFIVRTELGRISQAANEATMNQVAGSLPGLQKEWCALVDANTRPTHRAANGQRVAVDADFKIGGHPARYPHDPRLPAGESVGCRCMALPWHPTFEEPLSSLPA